MGTQISPVELENTLLNQPDGLISDIVVAGVHILDVGASVEKVPHAWIVLTDAGQSLGADKVFKRLDIWIKESLHEHKWMRGGFEVVNEVCHL